MHGVRTSSQLKITRITQLLSYFSGMKWMDNVADDILEPLTEFQSRFYARQPQLHPVLDCYASYMLKLYDHYEPYVADAMIVSSCTFIDGSCLEVHALSKRVSTKRDAKLWPYYVRSLSGPYLAPVQSSILFSDIHRHFRILFICLLSQERPSGCHRLCSSNSRDSRFY